MFRLRERMSASFQETAAAREPERNRTEVLEIGGRAKLLTVMF